VAAEHAHEAGLAGRYALAIFELAQEERAVETVAADFAALKQLMEKSPELTRLIRAPVFSREEQAAGMNGVLHRMEAAPLTRRFILLLASKRRLFALADIVRAFGSLVAKQKGEMSAQVTSARPLSADETSELKSILRSKLSKDVILETRLDPSLLGGLIVKVGSRMIDSSLRTKLNGMRMAMRGANHENGIALRRGMTTKDEEHEYPAR
jgi:F-type H+-transporting ATPase subunit delta